jgi:hypothetical protein
VSSYHAITACRLCGGKTLTKILDLGEQALTGVFPKRADVDVPKGPLVLVKCMPGEASGEAGVDACGLVQLAHSFEPTEMYGENYGYRSGLNRSMVEHLRRKVEALLARTTVGAGDVVLDIGSNDGTTLSFYPKEATLIGIDPTSAKFARYYPPHVKRVAAFFDAKTFFEASAGARARIVTSIAMFYDLERPLDFARDVHAVLEDGGIWHFEQSYLPMMLDATSYDTVCHEHLEYYALRQIDWIARRAGFHIVDVTLNDVNGGSFAVTAVKGPGEHAPVVLEMLAREDAAKLDALAPYLAFEERVAAHGRELRALVERLTREGKKVFALGASTKGNVILQYCGLGPELVPCVAEVNEDKFGAFTPGTKIPIVSEADAFAQKPDYLLVLPWHFRRGLLERGKGFVEAGGRYLFPLPRIEVVPEG